VYALAGFKPFGGSSVVFFFLLLVCVSSPFVACGVAVACFFFVFFLFCFLLSSL
jgi:hypothetical protein